jgi:amphi-Trp domain-containing protein
MTAGMEPPVSDVEVSRTESLTRHEAADWLSALAAALGNGGQVKVEMGASTLKLHVPENVRCEVEVEIDGDEVELEVELKWSTSAGPPHRGPVGAEQRTGVMSHLLTPRVSAGQVAVPRPQAGQR